MNVLALKPRKWLSSLPTLVLRETSVIVGDFRRSWRVLWALTFIESRGACGNLVCQIFSWAAAWRRIQVPKGTIKPVFSAMGMKTEGWIKPYWG